MSVNAYEIAKSTADFIKTQTKTQPKLAIICGSGLGVLADDVDKECVLPYHQIPNFPQASVAGHAGQLVFGTLCGMPVVLMQGRFHRYEGYTSEEVTRIVRVFRELGAETLIVTNAAGALNKSYHAGDIMLIKDHLSFANLTLQNPLVGPNDERLGVRFPDVSNAYCVRLRMLTRKCAQDLGIPIQEGVFALAGGPSYETPAEVRALRMLGGDAVAMSTAPEVTVARHVGMRCLGFSMISNVCKDEVPEDDSQMGEIDLHKEVLETVETKAIPNMKKLLAGIITEMIQNPERWKKDGAVIKGAL